MLHLTVLSTTFKHFHLHPIDNVLRACLLIEVGYHLWYSGQGNLPSNKVQGCIRGLRVLVAVLCKFQKVVELLLPPAVSQSTCVPSYEETDKVRVGQSAEVVIGAHVCRHTSHTYIF